MRYLKVLFMLCFSCGVLFTSCVQEEAGGSTISSQVTGTFNSTEATIVSENEMLLDASEGYEMIITEVDANTVSVLTEYTRVFEVDLEKSENGTFTMGTTNSAGSGFTFVYNVSEGVITVNHASNDVTMSYVGVKQ